MCQNTLVVAAAERRGLSGFAALLVAAGCSGKVSVLPDGGGGGSDSGGASTRAGSSASSAGSTPSASGGGGSPGAGGFVSGASGSGGTTDAGNSTGEAGSELLAAGAAGSTSAAKTCGGPTAIQCPTGQFCDLASHCGAISLATGICAATGVVGNCDDVEDPEGPSCGCEGKNYVNACQRQALGMLERSVGPCPGRGIASYPTAYGVWQAPRGDGGTGPAVVVSGAGFVYTWDSVPAFPPETPATGPSSSRALSLQDTDDLFLRLAGVPTASIPHPPAVASDCRLTFYFRLCDGCAVRTVSYDSAEQVLPEMAPAWTWFDRILGASMRANPRNFCHGP